MGSDAGLERLELEDELGRAIESIMLERLSELETRTFRPGILYPVEVLVLSETIAKELLAAGWRRG